MQKTSLSGPVDPNDELAALKLMKEMQNSKTWKERPSSKMFWKLLRYIAGVNKEREQIEMTTPVINTKTPLEVRVFLYINANCQLSELMCEVFRKKIRFHVIMMT
jgi:hypothetical protein